MCSAAAPAAALQAVAGELRPDSSMGTGVDGPLRAESPDQHALSQLGTSCRTL